MAVTDAVDHERRMAMGRGDEYVQTLLPLGESGAPSAILVASSPGAIVSAPSAIGPGDAGAAHLPDRYLPVAVPAIPEELALCESGAREYAQQGQGQRKRWRLLPSTDLGQACGA